MKPFDLEAAKRGEPIQCRDGRPAKFIGHVPEAHDHNRIVFLLEGFLCTAYESGRIHDLFEKKSDLVMAPKKRTVWVNFYENNFATFFNTQEEADRDHQETQFDIDRLGNRAYPVEVEK